MFFCGHTFHHQGVVQSSEEVSCSVVHLHGVHPCLVVFGLLDDELVARQAIACAVLWKKYTVLIPVQKMFTLRLKH